MNEGGRRKVEGGIRIGDRLALRNPYSGMTLIELLIAISIVAILATLLLGVAAKATQTAREARTKQLISRLHTLVMERYESYRIQRVELDSKDVNSNDLPDWRDRLTLAATGINTSSPPLSSPEWLAAGRLAGIRELMKMEMPERWSDILLEPVPTTLVPVLIGTSAATPLFVEDRTSINRLYLRRYNEAVVRATTREVLIENESAECLYLMVMNATDNGEARSLFKESDIGDTDGDGAPEFIDAWGKPIGWLRWAPGYDSDLQTSFASLKRVYDRPSDRRKGEYGKDGVEEAIATDHDPFDLFQADKFNPSVLDMGSNSDDMTGARGWRLVPLVFSAGPDEELGLYLDGDMFLGLVDPYVNDIAGIPGKQRLGGFSDPDKATDNITNHHITAK